MGGSVDVRRMFPSLKLRLSGLDPERNYVVVLDMVGVDEYRYKYQDSRWVVAGKADQPVLGRQTHVHVDSPAPGRHWMSRAVSFHKLKLTNNVVDKHAHVCRSMRPLHMLADSHYIAPRPP